MMGEVMLDVKERRGRGEREKEKAATQAFKTTDYIKRDALGYYPQGGLLRVSASVHIVQ